MQLLLQQYIDVLKTHKRNKHKNIIIETKKTKVNPPPKCNPNDASHSPDCCNRNPSEEKAVIFTHEQKRANGICLEWNKGNCDHFELCKCLHIEIEACRFANYCSRTNCKFWHNIPGKFPFIEETNFPRRNW